MGKQDRQQNQTTKEDRGSPVKDDRTSPKEVAPGQTRWTPKQGGSPVQGRGPRGRRRGRLRGIILAGRLVNGRLPFSPGDRGKSDGDSLPAGLAAGRRSTVLAVAISGRAFGICRRREVGRENGKKEAPPTNPLKMASETTELHAQEGMAKHKPVAASDPWGPRPPSAAIGLSVRRVPAGEPVRTSANGISRRNRSKPIPPTWTSAGGSLPFDRGSRSPGASRGQKGEAARNDRPSDPFASPVGSTLAVPSYDQSTSAMPVR